jgi:hypothetical protein
MYAAADTSTPRYDVRVEVAKWGLLNAVDPAASKPILSDRNVAGWVRLNRCG